MKAFERLLIGFTNWLCQVFDVTPEEIEKRRPKVDRTPPPESRPDILQA